MEPQGDYAAACLAALEQALDRTPFYERWLAADPGRRMPLDVRYAALPALTKRDLRADMPKGFVPRELDWRQGLASGTVELVSTSGTSDDRSSILWYQPWWDASEHAAAKLHAGLDRVINGSQREAVLTTPLCAGNVCHVGNLTMEERSLGRLLFLNQKPDPTHWNVDDMDRMVDELDRFKPELLEADPAYLAVLARHAIERGLRVYQPRFISLTYEFPSRVHYRQIRRSFPKTSVVSSYGSTETGHVLTQCERGRFHQNTAYCRIDFQPLVPLHGGPRTGRILVSGLRNPWVALLRFDTGDLVRIEQQPCPCGRTEGLTAAAIEGRARDVTFSTHGWAVTVERLDASLGETEGLLAYQVEQTARTAYVFRYVAEPGLEVRVAAEGAARLGELYGPGATIEGRREVAIAAEQSGKFRLARTTFTWDPACLYSGDEVRP